MRLWSSSKKRVPRRRTSRVIARRSGFFWTTLNWWSTSFWSGRATFTIWSASGRRPRGCRFRWRQRRIEDRCQRLTIDEAGFFERSVRSSVVISRSAIKVRIRIIREGKPRDAHLAALQSDYVARIGHFVKIRIDESDGIAKTTVSSSTRSARGGGLPPGAQRLLKSLAE